MFYKCIRRLLFLLPPELAHHLSLSLLNILPQCCFKQLPEKPVTILGIPFKNSVGMAAGFDKDGDYIDALAKLNFGFIEVGTVTPRPQIGNPKPRLFRLVPEEALINRMGFNNKGVDSLVSRLQRCKYQGVIGVNIGKNKDTPIENAVEDYVTCLHKVYPYSDYIVINVSSPNTAELRQLQFETYLSDLLGILKAKQKKLQKQCHRYVPFFLKIAPDLNENEVKHISAMIIQHKIEGVIATNTAIFREGVEDSPLAKEAGGLSGRPLHQRSVEIIKMLRKYLKKDIPIIAVGGIMSLEDAQEKIKAGAQLVQVYTGFIYQGPQLIRELVENL